MKQSVLQDWVQELTFMQQSVLMASIRGPDTLPKDHISKLLLRWLRRCILLSAFDGRPIMNPYYEGGGSFTGPSLSYSLRAYSNGIVASDVKSITEMSVLFDNYLSNVDQVPHHFHLHFMHAVEILGFKHPIELIRDWWYQCYLRLANDMHLRPELEEHMDKRLGDKEKDWRAAEEVIAKAP